MQRFLKLLLGVSHAFSTQISFVEASRRANIILGCGKCNLLGQSLLQNHPPLLGGAGREELDLDLFLQTDNKLNSNLMGT